MNDFKRIMTGLIIFLILITLPIWYNIAAGRAEYRPEIVIATKDIPGKDKCVKDKEYMVSRHMDLLNQWRDQAVRQGNRIHTTPDGRKFNRSLSLTCMDCHSNKDKFCDRCHDYMKVTPFCWDCHIEPKKETQ